MRFEHNPYYSPENCGLKIIETIDTADSYEFNIFAIWQKLDDNTFWYDTDSGCSCPSPFDNSDHGHDLIQITIETFYNFDEALKNHYRLSKEDYHRIKTKVSDLLNKL